MIQIGSLVICPNGSKGSKLIPTIKDVPPSEDIIYTVENVFNGWNEDTLKKENAIVLEELNVNSMWGYAEKDFVEVQPPFDVSSAIKEPECMKFIRKGKKLEKQIIETLGYAI